MSDAFRDRMMAATRVVRSEEAALKRRIASLYEQCAGDMAQEILRYGEDSLTGRRAAAIQESMQGYVHRLWQEIGIEAHRAVRRGASLGTASQVSLLDDALAGIGITASPSFASVFARTQDEAVATILNGAMYAGKRTGLSRRIWNNEALQAGNIEQIIAAAVAEGQSAPQLARDLEAYVNPKALMPDHWNDIYPCPFNYKVDYNAKRLAVTALNHAYYQGTVMAARQNPYAEFLHWELSSSHEIYDVCDLYMEHDEGLGLGNFSLDNAPLPHPFCRCTWYIDSSKSLDEIGNEIGRWVNGEKNDRLDEAFGAWKEAPSLDNTSGYRYHEDGTIVVTDDWKERFHPKIPSKYQSYAVVETCSGVQKQVDRTFYDADGAMRLQIHGGSHSHKPAYGHGGAHAHDYENGKRVVYDTYLDGRELTEQEVKENGDIIPES